jgi:endonuclease YncB( thermonuclease family)
MTRARSLAVFMAFALGALAGATLAPVIPGRSAPMAGELWSARDPPPIRGAYAAETLRVIDGDTFEARVHLWPGLAVTTRVRLRGIDAPETNARCLEERNRAAAARAALASILDEADLTVFRVSLDKYGGRVLAAAATARTPDVARALLGAGLARRYAGGRREPWCSG